MRGSRLGLGLGAGAYVLWGLFPLYWPLLEPASPLEILAWRVLLTVVVVTVALLAARRLRGLHRLDRITVRRLCLAGAVIAVNWGLYIWGVNNAHVVEISLGYFINPILTVALGVVLLRERLRRVQWAAVALGAASVLVLSADYGHPPWLALALAISFAVYGLIKKHVRASPAEGLLVEGGALALPAVAALAVLAARGTWTLTGPAATPEHLLLVAAAGPATAIPLLLFAGAATRLPLSTMGLLQYLAPVMQFAIGVLVRGEPLPPARLAGFAVVWLALAILTVDALRHHRALPSVVAEAEIADVGGAGAAEPA